MKSLALAFLLTNGSTMSALADTSLSFTAIGSSSAQQMSIAWVLDSNGVMYACEYNVVGHSMGCVTFNLKQASPSHFK